MNRSILIAPAVLAACFVHPTIAQDDFAGVKIIPTHVNGAVYMLEGRGGNIGVSVGDDGILIVDDQFAPLADRIKAALGELGKGKLKFVLNTHWHGDHTGGNPIFGKDAPIISHTNVRKRLSTKQTLFGNVKEPLPKEGLPVITFDQALTIHFNDEEIRMVHFPHGHTDGDSVVFFSESNAVHMGDLFFNGMFPFVDLDHGGNVVTLADNLGRILEMLAADIKVIPGHGPLSTPVELKAYREMIVETIKIVREQKDAGKTLAEIKANGLPNKFEPWTKGFINTDKWLEAVYNSIAQVRDGS
jgi:glyoxylase-like metal-dependent hydrolase (beta-lactamase superfamily II)